MKAYEIYLIKGRISFELDGKRQGSPNFGSVLVVFEIHDRKFPELRPFYHKRG